MNGEAKEKLASSRSSWLRPFGSSTNCKALLDLMEFARLVYKSLGHEEGTFRVVKSENQMS